MNAKKVRKKVRMLALVLTTLVLLSLALSGAGTGVIGMEHGSRQELQTVTARAQGSTGDDVPLAGEGEWAQALVEISGAPDDAVVSSVRVKYHVVDAEPSGLDVQLLTSGSEVSHALWNKESAEGTVLTQSTDEITTFQGAPVNGTWSLAVQGGDLEGYIDDFSVVVYYETEMPVLQVEGEGAPGTPGFLRLPEDAAPSSPSPDDDEKPGGAGSSVVPQDVPPGATIIKADNFEGSFPNGLWDPHDNSSDGYQRYWDDAQCDRCGGDWALWPADGGANGVYPCTPNDYPNNMFAWVEYGPFNLSDATDAGTEFVMWYDIEVYFDWVFFGVSEDGVNYTGIFWDGYDACTRYNITYTDWVGDPSVWVAWVFYSDSSIRYPGPWVDDVVIWKDRDCATLRVDPPHTEAGTSFTVDVAIDDANDLGAFEFELTYDHTCIDTVSPCADAVTPGPFLGSTGRSVGEVGPVCGTGSVTYGAYSWGASPGPNGTGVLASVDFRVVSSSECSSDLHLQNVSVTDTGGTTQCVWLVDGTVHYVPSTCDATCPEDINLDGVINIVDIQLVASKYGQHCPTR
jgi:hypothetical protein